MPKNKILIYLLSTTLVLPTLVSPTAYADTPQKDTTAKTTSHDSKKSTDDETIFYRTLYFIADRTDCP